MTKTTPDRATIQQHVEVCYTALDRIELVQNMLRSRFDTANSFASALEVLSKCEGDLRASRSELEIGLGLINPNE